MLVLSVVNRKGGVGKTTTVFNLSYALYSKGIKTLAIDLDPQASLTTILGFNPDEIESGIDKVILSAISQNDVNFNEIILQTDLGFYLAPSKEELELANVMLTDRLGKEFVLKNKLNDVSGFDIAIIDCQTSISLLTINALAASDYVLIPVELTYLSMQGFDALMNVILEIKRNINPNLKILGILPTKYDARLNTVKRSIKVLESLKKHYNIFPPVKKTVSFDKSIERGKPIFLIDTKSARDACKAYERVVDKILEILYDRG